MKMNWAHVFFSTEGEMTRKGWWFSNLVIWALMTASGLIWHFFGFHAAIVGMLFTILDWWFHVNINMKRLRHRGKHGWSIFWGIVIAEIPVIGWIYGIIAFGCIKGANDTV